MVKQDSPGRSDTRDKMSKKPAPRPAYLQRVFDSIPAQIDAIKAAREQDARELRQFVRKMEEGEKNS
ncbi:MAG: hypothetical protein H6988_01035 [Pseudomonadales bacterium]|nr:hypothetical protein [Halieaceae bacterium]MCP5164008.1 hypothetical protein [Pseudomonadales bacterium]MCP5188956.1 hypothetical protein [Pseudomonadales bacterium]MCP5203057.1 hypothetical protein [Pseudomonadales bacterium]